MVFIIVSTKRQIVTRGITIDCLTSASLCVLSSIAVALYECALISGQHAVHLLTADESVLKFELHLIDVFLKLLEKGEHFDGLRVETVDF